MELALLSRRRTGSGARTADELATRHVALLLLSANNIAHDGGSAALRAYGLYRYALANYIPFERDDYVFAVLKDLAVGPDFAPFIARPAADVDLFEQAFAVADLKSIALAWGASAAALDPSFGPGWLDAKVVALGGGRTGLGPTSTRDERAGLPALDMLRLTRQCKQRGGSMRLKWLARWHDTSSSYELAFVAAFGILLVPVGSRPAWALADDITEVALVADGPACSVHAAQWLQRKHPVVAAR